MYHLCKRVDPEWLTCMVMSLVEAMLGGHVAGGPV